MTTLRLRELAKEALARVPGSAAAYQRLVARGKVPSGGYRLDRLARALPGWVEHAERARDETGESGKRILILAGLKWWLEHAVALGLLLHSQGHNVELAYVPYRRWSEALSAFDCQRQSAYLQSELRVMEPIVQLHDLPAMRGVSIPRDLAEELEEQSYLDVQYTLQREGLRLDGDPSARRLMKLRRDRNRAAAAAVLSLLEDRGYDSVVIPNGSILEFGAVFRMARWLNLPAVTYEFGEQQERVWLARDRQVMRLPTDELWAQRGEIPLTEQERVRISSLYQARMEGRTWSNFTREWQPGESAGATAAREVLGLNPVRPIVLLCTNVVGDSLALNRQIFTDGMADWLERTVRFFKDKEDAQLIVRVHPGELLGAGHPSVDILSNAFPELPPSIKVVPPESKVNTYDLIELSQLGLAYTSTVGLEMAMFGVPVIVAGDTHYRGKGFTQDPVSLDGYLSAIDGLLNERNQRLPPEQVELAWRYAYRFFFEYPFRYPWHLVTFWEDMNERPFSQVVEAASERYGPALSVMVGRPIEWARAVEVPALERPA